MTTVSCDGEGTKTKTEVSAENLAFLRLDIDGMTCPDGCAKPIEQMLSEAEGVSSAEVDFEKKAAFINYDKTVTSEEKLMKLISDYKDGAYSSKASAHQCAKDCEKACCAKKCAADCSKPCCASKAKKSECAADCTKPCCAEKKAKEIVDGVIRTTQNVESTVSKNADKIKNVTSKAGDKVKSTTDKATNMVKKSTQNVKSTVSKRAGSVKKVVNETKEDLKNLTK